MLLLAAAALPVSPEQPSAELQRRQRSCCTWYEPQDLRRTTTVQLPHTSLSNNLCSSSSSSSSSSGMGKIRVNKAARCFFTAGSADGLTGCRQELRQLDISAIALAGTLAGGCLAVALTPCVLRCLDMHANIPALVVVAASGCCWL
jgi:hypothetical protein